MESAPMLTPYSTAMLQDIPPEENRWKAIPLFLRSILDRPQLAQYVKVFRIFHPDNTAFRQFHHIRNNEPHRLLTRTHLELLAAKIDDYFGNGDERECFYRYHWRGNLETRDNVTDRWEYNIEHGNDFGPMTAVLLLYLQNIEELDLVSYPVHERNIFAILLTAVRIQLGRISFTPYSFPRLRQISVASCLEEPGGWYSGSRIAQLLAMPSLDRFACDRTGMSVMTLPPQFMPGPINNSARNLSLLGCEFTLRKCRPVWSQCHSLNSLKVEFYKDDDSWADWVFSMDLFIDSILHLTNSLEKLTIFDRSISPLRYSLPIDVGLDLTAFRLLRSLQIEGKFLSKKPSELKTCQLFTFAKFPPSLEKLTIRHSRQSDVEPQLSTNLVHLQSIPKLKRLCIRLYDNEDFDVKDETWKVIARSYGTKGVVLSFETCEYHRKIPWAAWIMKRIKYVYDEGTQVQWRVIKRTLHDISLSSLYYNDVANVRRSRMENRLAE